MSSIRNGLAYSSSCHSGSCQLSANSPNSGSCFRWVIACLTTARTLLNSGSYFRAVVDPKFFGHKSSNPFSRSYFFGQLDLDQQLAKIVWVTWALKTLEAKCYLNWLIELGLSIDGWAHKISWEQEETSLATPNLAWSVFQNSYC